MSSAATVAVLPRPVEKRIRLWQAQADFVRSSARHPAFVGGWGTGKSLTGIMRAVFLSEKFPNNLGIIFRREFTDLRDCFDARAEILTDSGWKFFSELEYADEVLSLNPTTGFADYSAIDRIVRQNYDGEMISLKKRDVEFTVTPNHRFLISGETTKNGRKARWPEWRLAAIRDIGLERFWLKRDFAWSGRERKTISIRPSKMWPMTAKSYIFDMDDWLEFLGWFLSEGHVYKHRTKKTWWVTISQSLEANSNKCRRIGTLLRRMGLASRMYAGEKFVFGSRAVGEHLLRHCGHGAGNKKLPDYLRCLSSRQISIFLDSFKAGDGYDHRNAFRLNTSSPVMAGELQESVLKTGQYASVITRDAIGRRSWINDHWATTRKLDHLISVHSALSTNDISVHKSDLRRIHYKGEIFCVDVKPHHTIYVRVNGKCFWSGNSTVRDFQDYTGMKLNASRDVVFPNGSTIMFRHLEELNNLQNINLGWFWIEQAEELDTGEEFLMLKGRLRRADVPHSGFLTANTRGHNWIHRLFKMSLLDGAALFEAASADNAANLPPDTVEDWERLRMLRPAMHAQFVLNSWDEAEEANVVIPLRLAREAVNRSLPLGTVHRRLTVCDVAGESETSDETVIYDFDGPRVVDSEFSRGREVMDAVGRVMSHAQKNGSRLVVVDRVGMGEGVYSALKQAYDPENSQGSFPMPTHGHHVVIHGFDSRLSPPAGSDEATYANYKAYAWFAASRMFAEGRVSIPNDEVLISQLSSVTFRYLQGRLALTPKDKLTARLGHSPDRADALVMGLDGLRQVEAVVEGAESGRGLWRYKRRVIEGSGYHGR